ncbi:hypothetical protein [Phenylobacterium sp. SCN 70-31]|uniref:hypothetical protein n=1 Tax=Phenylobacterium sp. SCN 70-31 TaxID=1660129 RepID=UPI0025E3BF8B|nr:hypothetical protein [Phenylobacterium sp. SCN 70-31]
MVKIRRSTVIPVIAAGLASLALAGCSTYGAGNYGYAGRSSASYGYGAPYSSGRASIYVAPRAYDRGYYSYSGAGRYGSRGYSSGHNGFSHLGGRRH